MARSTTNRLSASSAAIPAWSASRRTRTATAWPPSLPPIPKAISSPSPAPPTLVTDCPACSADDVTPQGSVSVPAAAVPTSFGLLSWTDVGNGDLHQEWHWASSTGHLPDLSACSVSENVVYSPGTGFFNWPLPFPAVSSPNPTTGQVPATDGIVSDDHDLGGKLDTDFRKPYFSNSFTAKQTISYSCTYGSNKLSGTLFGPTPVVRTVAQNPNGSWFFTVSEAVGQETTTATINPLP